MTNLSLRHGLSFADLYDRDGLVGLDRAFVSHLAETDIGLHDRLMAARRDPGGGYFLFRDRPAAASPQVAPVAASDLAPSSIEDDVPDRSRVAIDRRPFEHRTSMVERLDHLVGVDDFHVKKPIELAEILDGEVHALSW